MSVDQSGALDEVIQDFEYWEDSGVHGTAFNKDSTILYAADTLGNALWAQKIDVQTGKLNRTSAIISGPSDHTDPRHIVVHTSGNALYAVMEGSNEMGWYEIDKRTQIPLLRGLFPLLPKELLGSKNHWANEVVVSPSGQYIWSTTRGKGNYTGYISVFEADTETGEILGQNFLRQTSTSGGVANVVIPSEFDDHIIALTDNAVGSCSQIEGMQGTPPGAVQMLCGWIELLDETFLELWVLYVDVGLALKPCVHSSYNKSCCSPTF
jgi:carboxy-cis,cis-muconate cyclase